MAFENSKAMLKKSEAIRRTLQFYTIYLTNGRNVIPTSNRVGTIFER